jgi:very-short-patch-repair endonuclease
MDVPGWPEVFRGSAAVAAGLVTKGELRGRRFVRLFPDTYALAGRMDLALRSRAAYRYVEGRGVLAGYSAAELLGASCGPADAPAEVLVAGPQRSHPGLLVHRDRFATGETTRRAGVVTTSPLRTAYDLARRGSLVERVVAVDALARIGRFGPDVLLNFARRYAGTRGNDGIFEVLSHADRRAGSPMESRLRMLLVLGGLPRPEAQWPVQDERARTAVWLDLAYPRRRVGIEYEGADHTTPDAVLRDAGRYTTLVDKGWRIYRYTKFEILQRPDRIVEQVARALDAARST